MTLTTRLSRLAELEARRRRLDARPRREAPPEVRHAEHVYEAEVAAHGDQSRAVQVAEAAYVGARWGDGGKPNEADSPKKRWWGQRTDKKS